MTARWVSIALALALIAGCGRRVVLDPSQIPARNDPAWKIHPAPPGARS